VPQAEKLLLDLYSVRKPKFDGTTSSIRHNTLYNEMEPLMKAGGVNVTAKQCKRHMNQLLHDFRIAFDGSRKTGGGAIEFEHFDVMMNMFKGSATLVTPYGASVGKGLKYTVNGVKNKESSSGTRTRPRSSASNTSKEGASGSQTKKKLYKSSKQELIEKQIELKEKQNEEFRLVRIGFEKKSEERTKMIQQLVQLAFLQMQMNMGHKKPTLDEVQSMQKHVLQQLQPKKEQDITEIELD